MHKNTKLITFLIIIASLLFVIVVAAGAYYFGLKHQEAEIQVLKNDRAILINQSAQNNDKLNKSNVNYDTACLEYQKLYVMYNALYDKTGDSSGQQRYTSPDSARDNHDSCYN